MVTFGDRLKHLRESRGLTQEQLGMLFSVKKAAISKYESGSTSPDLVTVSKLADYFSVTTDYLLGRAAADTLKMSITETAKAGVKIPVLGRIPAGIPLEAIEDILDWEEIPVDWLNGDREYFGLRVTGDSMFPTYLEGDTVIVLKQSTCDSGDDCVVIIDGTDATLKRVYITPEYIELVALNPMHGRKRYTNDEVFSIPVSILGVVVELRRKTK